MYGLETAPRAWQQHFAETVQDMGPTRLRSEPNVYYALCTSPRSSYTSYRRHPRRRPSGLRRLVLRTTITEVVHQALRRAPGEWARHRILGRLLCRDHDGVHLLSPNVYVQDVIHILGLEKGEPANTTGTSSPTRKDNGTSAICPEDHRVYRHIVGKLLWLDRSDRT